jgi:hypothetical protein
MLIKPFYLSNMIKFIDYIYPLNHIGKGLTLFLFSKIFILSFSEYLSYTTKNKHSCSYN